MLIAVIGIALAAFVLGDFLGYGPGARPSMDIAKINRHTVTYQEFEQRVAERLESWRLETGQQVVGQAEAYQIRQQIWNEISREIILDQELERLGLEVTREELFDMIHGPEPHPVIIRSFTNPADGRFDAQDVINFLRNFDRLEPTVRMQWANMERYMKRERAEEKYHTLISKAYHVPSALAAVDFQDRNASADFRFVFMPYAEVADSLVRVSDRDLRRVYDENKERFRQEASRDIAYVTFDVRATAEDREALQAELLALKDEFTMADDVAAFVNAASDMRYDARFYRSGELPLEIDELFFDAEPGVVHGPFVDNDVIVLARLVATQLRPDSLRASHILFAYSGAMGAEPTLVRTSDRAREMADSVLEVARRNPARFGELAVELSDDNSANFNQGDLDWFPDGAMVPGFNEAVVNTNTGSFTVAESEFGFHVIHVTGKTPPVRKVQVAFLTRNIEPSSRTYQSVYARASEFASELRKNRSFNQVADEKGVPVRVAEYLGEMDFSVPGIENPRVIVQWAFLDDTKKGSFSRIFELDNRFVIAALTELRHAGIPPLEQVREEVMEMALQEKKFEQIAGQIKNAGSSLDAIAEELGREVITATDIRFNTINLPVAGNEPKVIGAAFAMENNTLSGPIKGNNGVYVVEMQQLEMAILPDDLSPNKRMLQGNVTTRVPMEVFPALKKKARVEDNRNLFF